MNARIIVQIGCKAKCCYEANPTSSSTWVQWDCMSRGGKCQKRAADAFGATAPRKRMGRIASARRCPFGRRPSAALMGALVRRLRQNSGHTLSAPGTGLLSPAARTCSSAQRRMFVTQLSASSSVSSSRSIRARSTFRVMPTLTRNVIISGGIGRVIPYGLRGGRLPRPSPQA